MSCAMMAEQTTAEEEAAQRDLFFRAQSEHYAMTLNKLTRSPSSSACSDAIITPLLEDKAEDSGYFLDSHNTLAPAHEVNGQSSSSGHRDQSTANPSTSSHLLVQPRLPVAPIANRRLPELTDDELIEGLLDVNSPFPLPNAALLPGERHHIMGRGFGMIPPPRKASSSGSSCILDRLQSRFSFDSSTHGSGPRSNVSQRSSCSTVKGRPPSRPLLTRRNASQPPKFGATPTQPWCARRAFDSGSEEDRCAANFAFSAPSPLAIRTDREVARVGDSTELSLSGLGLEARPGVCTGAEQPPCESETASRPGSARRGPGYRVPVKHDIVLKDVPTGINVSRHIRLDAAAMAKSSVPHKLGAYANSHASTYTLACDAPTEGATSVSRNVKSASLVFTEGKKTFFQKLRPDWTKISASSKTPMASAGSASSLSTLESQALQTPRCSRQVSNSSTCKSGGAPTPGIHQGPFVDGKVEGYVSWTSKMKPVLAGHSVDVQERIERRQRTENPGSQTKFHLHH
jgi:hypothetical protein